MENPLVTPLKKSITRTRVAVSLFYVGQGVAFASWASRIPEIKEHLHLTDAQFGALLLALPAGQLCTMPISAKLVTNFGSKKILSICAPLYVIALTNLGLANANWQLAAFLFLFGVIGNMCNISVNTQGIEAEKLYAKPIMTSFHGAWSLANFSGALIALLMINLGISPYCHYWIIAGLIWINVLINHKYLVEGKAARTERKPKFFTKPEGVLLQLGIIGFCSMATEGAMFDWSGIYFEKIVMAPKSVVILGYASFMIMMAMGRFFGDRFITKFGRKKTLQLSGLTASAGLFISVLFPYLPSATLGFMLVGLGVSGIVPTVYSIAGRNTKVSAGMALAMVSSVSYLGFLMGPPLIGFVSGLFNLRYSYALIACFGLLVTFIVTKIKAID
ncbi:MFS family permease [Pedobacter sp. UYP30]|uniref:MFS transporter n=1 Tax=Pedobacter sp. UYP30 TaxID=1756400 RepID=UPI003393FC14